MSPPLHIPIAYGPIESTEIADEKVANVGQFCQLCNAPFQVSLSWYLFSPFDHDMFISKMKVRDL